MITIYTYYLFFFLKQSNRKKYMAISKSAHYFIIYFYVRISFLFLFLIFQPNSIHRFHSVLILSAPTHSATFPLLCLLSHPMLSTVLQELLHLFFFINSLNVSSVISVKYLPLRSPEKFPYLNDAYIIPFGFNAVVILFITFSSSSFVR